MFHEFACGGLRPPSDLSFGLPPFGRVSGFGMHLIQVFNLRSKILNLKFQGGLATAIRDCSTFFYTDKANIYNVAFWIVIPKKFAVNVSRDSRFRGND
jgi:hypothetical protein